MTSNASESEAKKNSLTSGAGPRLKNGGGVWSIPRYYQSLVKIGPKCSIFSSALPEPRTTQVSGSSATMTGRPVSSISRRSRSRSSAPPPVSTMPFSAMSAPSSGGVCSSAHFAAGEGRADLLLDQLGGRLADQHAVVAADVVDDRLVELVAADAHRARVHHAAERDHADFRRAAADVDHHRAGRVGYRQIGADGGSHGLLDQIHLARAGANRRFPDRAALYLSRAAGHADDDAGGGREQLVVMHFLDELLEHLLGDGEVGDHAVLHRPDGDDVAGGLAQHHLDFLADRLDGLLAAGARLLADGAHRGLVQDNALAPHVDERVGGAEVDGQVVGKVAAQESEHGQGRGLFRFLKLDLSAAPRPLKMAAMIR